MSHAGAKEMTVRRLLALTVLAVTFAACTPDPPPAPRDAWLDRYRDCVANYGTCR